MSATGEATRAHQSGSTLIEMLVVLTITAMAALIGFPLLQRSVAPMEQRQAIAAVSARLRQVRATALRTDHAAVFTVSADGGSFGDSVSGLVPTPPGVSLVINAVNRRIVFYGDGSSSGGVVRVRSARRGAGVAVSSPGGVLAIGP
jgi:prepilin-type N-terminal cleavage/methylation domain-containing protein